LGRASPHLAEIDQFLSRVRHEALIWLWEVRRPHGVSRPLDRALGDVFDFVIVGSGSAGAALAHRLSEDGRSTVCVIEFGGSDASPFVQMPAALSIPMNSPRYDWGYVSEPEPGLGGRRIHHARGKVIGGSSSINGMVAVRGHPKDFDRWADQGAAGWGHADVLPYFRRMETYSGGADQWRGADGPLAIRRPELANPLYRAFIEAGRQAGHGVTEDHNGFRQEGFGPMQMTVRNGRRWSAANAYLRPALQRGNMRLITRALARRIMFDGRRASGVEIERGGTVSTIPARREVILAAGAFGSPHLLKLSGIGPARELAAFGIACRADRPGVGANLQDHLEYWHQVASTQPITLFGITSLWRKGLIGLRWMLTGHGQGATNHFEACGFIRSRPELDYPDLQYHFLPMAVSYSGHSQASEHGYQAHVGPNHPRSRGALTLISADPREKPKLVFNYLSEEQDRIDFRNAFRLTRALLAQPAFDPYRGRDISPDASITADAEIDAFIASHAETAYHPCGTCRIGRADDPTAVVDPECRVIGVEGLRVADSSIIPLVTNGNLNLPTIMIGEKAADHTLGKPPLPRSNAAVYSPEATR
jgi:choline dehydrogenase